MSRGSESTRRRKPLTRKRVLRAALALADRDGVESLTMRRLGGKLGVEAMALYKHVANKDDILDGIAELVVREIEIPAPFSVQMATHAFWLLDSYVYGHVIQEISLPIGTPEQTAPAAGQMLDQPDIGDYPHLAEVAAEAMASGYSIDREFEFGLDLVLDALEGIRTRAR
jgi:AcrR family transcriptional regulator